MSKASELIKELKNESCLTYGKCNYSTACVLCMSHDHNEINLMRAKKHLSFEEISQILEISEKLVRKHFSNHFILNSATQRILSIKENTSQEAMDIITNIFEGNLDIYAGIDLVLKSKAERLLDTKERLKEMRDNREKGFSSDEDSDDTLMYCKLQKVAEDIERSMIDAYKTANDRLFPADKEEMSRAILNFKISILQGLLDRIITTFIQYENDHPNTREVIADLKSLLSFQFNDMELSILRSGGKMLPDHTGEKVIETEASVEDSENN